MSESKTVKEVVVYRIKPGQVSNFLKNGLPELKSCALGFEGIINHKTMQSPKTSEVFIDIVEWDSLKSAEKAAELMEEKTKAGELPYMMETFEKVEFFEHFNEVE